MARLRLAEAGLARLDELAGREAAPDAVIDRVRAQPAGPHRAHPRPHGRKPGSGADGLRNGKSAATSSRVENAELDRLYENGTISAATRQRLQHALDLEATRLSDEQH